MKGKNKDVIDAEVGPGDDTPIKARKKIPQKMVDGFLASGMRETTCIDCGCRMFTREKPRGIFGADLCPPCAGITGQPTPKDDNGN